MRNFSTLVAAAIISAAGMTTGCGSAQGTAAPHRAIATRCTMPAASRPGSGAMMTIGNADNGKVLCVKVGARLAVYLRGTSARKWLPIHASSPALVPEADGRLALMLGVTGAFFSAVHAGTAHLSSTRSGCQPVTRRCETSMVFHVTVIVSPPSPA
jgi:hypothetical protein